MTTGALGGVLGLVALSAVAGVLVAASITPAIAVTGAVATQAIDAFDSLDSELPVNTPMAPSVIYYIDAEGNEVELASFYDQNRVPLTYEQLTPMLIDAILSSEDKTFFEHGGINLGATLKAIFDYARGTSSRGASTITQQFVKNILIQQCEQSVVPADEDYLEKLRQCWEEATNASGQEGMKRKLNEMRYALQIDKDYSKEDILTGYLNIANFGGTNYGIEAAANYYFGKTVRDLTLSETATLAGIVQNPNTYRLDKPNGSWTNRDGVRVNGAHDGYATTRERRDYVLERMYANENITKAQYDAALATPIVPDIHGPINGCAAAGAHAYFCQYVKRTIETDPAFGETQAERTENLRRGGMKIYTTMDIAVQTAGIEVMQERVPAYRDNMEFGAAAVTIEVGTGRILAMVQNTTFTEREDQKDLPGYTGLVYAADRTHGGSSGFSVGSTYKLFTLLNWLENGRSVNEVLDGRARVFTEWTCHGRRNTNDVEIGNFAGNKGSISNIAQFTASSLNTGFFAMAAETDVCDINDIADRMGMRLGTGGAVNEQNALGDIIGSKNIPALDIANAYATIANGGIRCTAQVIDKIISRDGVELPLPEHSCERVLEPNIAATAAYTFAGVMSSGTGTASRPGDGIPLIGKTGTHERHQTMMVASSTRTTTAVWVGNTVGHVTLYGKYYNGAELSQLRHVITRAIVREANAQYGGGRFPSPDPYLLRTVEAVVPSVVGMNIDEVTIALKEAGFSLTVAEETVDSPLAEGLVVTQSRAPGTAIRGSEVVVVLSNGLGLDIPSVMGMAPNAAKTELESYGFTHVTIGACTEDPTAPEGGAAVTTSPGPGSTVNRSTPISILYEAPVCP